MFFLTFYWFRKLIVFSLKLTFKLFSLPISCQNGCYLFQSFDGKFISDSPWYLYKEISRRVSGKFIWVVRDFDIIDKSQFESFDYVEFVKYGTLKYYVSLAKASVIISNSRMPYFFSKSKDQTYIQTWHGTPLKKIGLDIGSATNHVIPYSAIKLAYESEAKMVDIFVSPSPYATDRFRTSFNLQDYQLLELGYPRNDLLVSKRGDDLYVDSLKLKFGIQQNSKVILYAPTYRDNNLDNLGVHRTINLLSTPAFTEKFGRDVVFLVRGHYFSEIELDNDQFIDVSHINDINELYLVSDALITDYSSVFFDYSLLDRPIYFYMPDYDVYEKEVRGFYLKVPEQLPGRVFYNSDQLADAIIDDGFELCNHRDFNLLYNPHEDGYSSGRYVDYLLNLICELNNE